MFGWKFETIENAKPKAEKLVVSSTRPVYPHKYFLLEQQI